MGKNITSLNAGRALREVLLNEVDSSLQVYPCAATQDAEPPYVIYQRVGVNTTHTKQQAGIDSCAVQFDIYTRDYASGVDLAEACRAALERKSHTVEDEADGYALRLDCSQLTDCAEDWVDDCYRQSFTIECKVSAANLGLRS